MRIRSSEFIFEQPLSGDLVMVQNRADVHPNALPDGLLGADQIDSPTESQQSFAPAHLCPNVTKLRGAWKR